VALSHVLAFIDKRKTFSVSFSSLVINPFIQVAIVLELALIPSQYALIPSSTPDDAIPAAEGFAIEATCGDVP
jgi:hypothetical protein